VKKQRLLNLLLLHGVAFGAAVALSTGCPIPDYPATAFRCSPGGESPCPEGYICCSDDPAAIDLDDINMAVLPEYQGRGGTGVPLFSGGNNSLSITGMCIAAGAVPIEGALADVGAQGCPVPCNPNWTGDQIEEVCGGNTICCQTVELDAKDCVLDMAVGDNGCYRPVTGTDIDGLGGLDATQWKGTEHTTHQDPSGVNCKTFVGGVGADVLEDKGITAAELERACFRRLTVADARGYCLGKSPSVQACPLEQPTYRDACEQLNDAEGRMGCD
jgi:hypothetical protein